MTKVDAAKFFGTYTALAKALGVTKVTVCNWPADIPAKYGHKLLAAMKAEHALRAKELDLREKLAAVRGGASR